MATDMNLQLELGIHPVKSGTVYQDLNEGSSCSGTVILVGETGAVDESMLYPGQRRVLNIIRNQVQRQNFDPTSPPLHLLVLGEGGTGNREVMLPA